MARKNDELAALFDEYAELLQIRGDDRFRILSYQRGADALRTLASDVAELSEKELTEVRGIGKALAKKIREHLDSGEIASLAKLREEIPEGVRLLTRVRGIGPKTARLLHDELGIADVAALKERAEAGDLRQVKGLGKKAEENILRALESYTPGEEKRVLLERALPLAESMEAELGDHPAAERVAFAGSVRRMRETIGDLDLLVASDDPDAVADAFRNLSQVSEVRASGETKTSVVVGEGLQVDLRVVPLEVFGAALQYFTGSKAHNVKVREHAVRRGYKLSEYGLFEVESGDRIAASTEEEVYERLGMQWVPPTLREDRGEVEAAMAAELPRPVEVGDLRGDLQSHSTYSDGRSSVREMALEAARLGHDYYAITDHGARRGGLKGLTLEEIAEQREEVRALDDELEITVLHGVEVDIGPDGEIGYPDDVLAAFDVVVASVHGWFELDGDMQTERMLRAIRHPHVHIIGHPTGRRIDKGRPGIGFDVGTVARAAAEHGVALEVNAHPRRLDLRDEHVRWALEQGAKLVISTDAHSPAELHNLRFGVGTAQRGWARADDVINTWPLDDLRGFLGKKG